MGKMEKINGGGPLEFFCNTKDHAPAHFHVKHRQDGWEIRVYFMSSTDKTRLLTFKNSYFAEHYPDDISLAQATEIFFQRVKNKFLFFLDFESFKEHRELVSQLVHHNKNLIRIIVEVEPNLQFAAENLINEFSLSAARKTLIESGEDTLKRVIHAWKADAQKVLIADFNIDADLNFYLRSCDFQFYQGSLKKINLFKEVAIEKIKKFSVDVHGNYIYWSDLDYHLDLNFFRGEIDPEFKAKQILKSRSHEEHFATKMKFYREEKKINQNSFDGLSDKQIRRYEGGESYPTYKAMGVIAKKFGLTVTEYFEELQKIKITSGAAVATKPTG